jgi:simple sugar transport system permease protein
MKVERRPAMEVRALHRIGAVAFGVATALAFGIIVSGTSLDVFNELWTSSFGTPRGIEDVATLALPLLLTGLAAMIPLRLGLWNIGGEGQLFIGAWAAAGVAFLLPGLTGPVLIPLMIAACLIGGAVFVLLPALARVRWNVNEIITTLLLNFVAAFWVLYWAGKPWRDPTSVGGVKSESIPTHAEIPLLTFGSVEIPAGFAIAVAIALLVWAIIRHTTLGYELTMLGASPDSARFAGIRTQRLLVYALLAGGAMAGLAGALEMMGNAHRFGGGLSNNTGYTGIVIAVLAAGSALGVIALSIVFALIAIIGGIFRAEGASSEIVLAMYGLTLIFAAVGQGLAQFKLVRRPADTDQPEPGDETGYGPSSPQVEGSRVG